MDATNRNTALASAMVEELARCGVREAVISPGSRSTPLALALWRDPAVQARVVLDERSAGFFALGAAQATRTPVAVLCTSGTAAANLHPAVCEADESNVPLIVLTADRPPELRGIGAGQTIDQIKLYGSAVRWFCEVGTHEADDAGLLHFRSVACRAFWTAAGDPRPGPVHLNVAWRDPLGPESRPGEVTATSPLALDGRGDRPLTTVPPARSLPAEQLLDSLVDRLRATSRGIIVAGRMAEPGAAAAIAELALATGYPILAEPTSQLRLGGHDRSLVVGAYEAIARARPDALIPELVLRFGEMPTCKALRQWIATLEQTPQLVIDPAHAWNDPGRIAGAIVRADAGPVARGLASRMQQAEVDESWSRAWLTAAAAAEAAIGAELDAAQHPTEPGLHRALGRAYGDGELVYTASSMPIRDQEAFVESADADVLFLANRGANGIDGLISSGIGAAAASGRPTVIVTGDLGLLHDLGGLAAAGEAEGPVRIVVVNNDGGAIFGFLPQAEQLDEAEFEALLGTPRGVDLVAAAALFGLDYRRVDDLAELAPALAAGTGLIEIRVDRDENVALHERLGAVAIEALERELSRGSVSPTRSGSSASSLSSVSASSPAGSESATMPAPAKRWAMRSRSSAERRATQNSPSSVASIQPTGPAYQPRSMSSSSEITRSATSAGSPPTAGVGCSSAASSTAESGSASCACTGVARCWMLATLISSGSESASTQTDRGASLRAMRRATISCSLRFFALCSSCSPRWSSTAGSALRRVEPASATVATLAPAAAHQQLRAGAEEHGLGRADAKAEAGGKRLTQGPEEGAWIVG